MKTRGWKISGIGVLLFFLSASLTVTLGGTGTANAASGGTQSMAAVYARIQTEYARKVVSLVNRERAAAGLKPLVIHTHLTNMAKNKAIDMYSRKYFSHNSPTFGSPFDMMDTYNITYRYAGENIAKGQRSAEEVVKAWMNSPGHKANIMNPNYQLIGVGYFNGYWVQEFIGK